jgi:hypothetical protein
MTDALRQRLLFAFLMSLLMSLLMSGWVTWLNTGLHPDFGHRWAKSFAAAWPAAFTIVVFCAPAVQRASQQLLRLVQKRS